MLDVAALVEAAKIMHQTDKRLVTVNGSFDILHAGHLDQLEEAKAQGDVLVVGINSDRSIQAEKGSGRPNIPEQARAALLAALVCVDYVVIIDAPYSEVQDILIDSVKPQVHVNGPQYGPPETWLEWPAMQRHGTIGYTVEKRNEISTSAIVEKIRRG